MLRAITTTWETLWPPARRRTSAIRMDNLRVEAESISQKQAEEKFREENARLHAERNLKNYLAHVKAVDFNGIATLNGKPMIPSEITSQVVQRLSWASRAKRELDINLADKMSDEEISSVTNKLDQTALNWLLQHNDPENQRKAATAIIRARADLDKLVPLTLYVTVVAEAVARSATEMVHAKIITAVAARAILLRSTDPRWTRTRHSELRPLSRPHW